ncbi:MAG: hypothetical protein ABUL62_12750 [Myxococcales bacterium]
MLTARVVLIDQTRTVAFEHVCQIAAALNLQVQRDLSPIWSVNATVSALPDASRIPAGAWPILLVDRLPAGRGGVHMTDCNQPYAKVEVGDGWTIAASHECLEMLVDPSGNRLYASNAVGVLDGRIRDIVGKFEYLVQVCDPSEDAPFSYLIDDVAVSDFCTPNYFDTVAAPGVRYSFTGAIKRPRDVLRNGFLSWLNPETGTVQQLRNFGAPQIADLGKPRGSSLRAFVDNKSRPSVALSELVAGKTEALSTAIARGDSLEVAAAARAKMYR